MFKKTKTEKKPTSRIVQQNHKTILYVVLLQVVCLFIGVSLSANEARRGVEQTAKIQASECARAIGTSDTSYVQEILNLYQEANKSQTEIDAKALYEISQSPSYKSMVNTLKFLHTSEVETLYLLALDPDSNNAILIGDSSQSLNDPSEIGITLELPETLLDGVIELSDHEDSGKTVYMESTNIYALGAQYLVEGDPSSGIVCVLCTDKMVIHTGIVFVLRYIAIMIVAFVFMVYYLNKRTMRLLVTPIDTITKAIESYLDDWAQGNPSVRHFAALGIHNGNEIEDLANTLAKMELDEAIYVGKLTQMAAEKEREEAELRMAARIQESALPSAFPAFPDRSEFDIYASMTPAKEVGGDFYDFFLVDDDHLCMVIADVSDKGIPAALFMMTSKTTIANHVMMGKSPAQALTDANKAICDGNKTGMFVTVWVGILEISTGRLTASNAAHEYPVVQRPRGAFALYRDRHGLMVGVLDNAEYTDYRIALRPGSKLFVYTDGVPEATNGDGEMFGLERMVDALNEDKSAAPEEVLGNVRRSVDEFVQDAPQFDDLTMLCLEYRGPKR